MRHNTRINPFQITGYVSPEYFCNRKAETDRIISAIENQRNLTLIALRRIGKTGLIEHVFHKLEKKKQAITIYIDIMATNNIKEFINLFATSILDKLESKPMQLLKTLDTLFKGFRPVISYDSLTGQPVVELTFNTKKEEENSLNQIFNYLKEKSKKNKIVICIDEFQQILNYPETNIEALLRSNIQKAPQLSFIFSGSHTHMLMSIFRDHKRPFYQSTDMMTLEKITLPEYAAFIKLHFQGNKVKISDTEIDYIYQWTRGHTYYVQYVCNRLYSSPVKELSRDTINTQLLNILKENDSLYYSYRKLLTDPQWRLLIAIAKENGVAQPLAKNFTGKYDLTTATVQTSLKSLIDKEMIAEENGVYQVYDLFLSRWLERMS